MKEMVKDRQLPCGIYHGGIGFYPFRHGPVHGKEVNVVVHFEFLHLRERMNPLRK